MEKDSLTGISVVIPAFNEQGSIQRTITCIQDMAQSVDYAVQIIVVDDGSTDRTLEVLEQYSVDVIKNEMNRGYGFSLKTGIREAKYDIVVISDADGTYPIDKIPDLITEYSDHGCDMVVGARTGETVNIPFVRKPAKWFITGLANYLTDTQIPDLNSGLRVMKKSIVEKFAGILPDGFSFTSTITLAMLTNDYVVHYIPVNYYKRDGKSKIRPLYDTLNFIQLVIRSVMYFNPLKVFLPLSGFFFLTGTVLFLYRVFIRTSFSVTIGLMFLTAFQILAIGMLAEIIVKRVK